MATWQPFAEALFEGRPSLCRVAAINLPGRGGSTLPSGLAFGDLLLDDHVSAILSVLEALDAEGSHGARIQLAGTSAGDPPARRNEPVQPSRGGPWGLRTGASDPAFHGGLRPGRDHPARGNEQLYEHLTGETGSSRLAVVVGEGSTTSTSRIRRECSRPLVGRYLSDQKRQNPEGKRLLSLTDLICNGDAALSTVTNAGRNGDTALPAVTEAGADGDTARSTVTSSGGIGDQRLPTMTNAGEDGGQGFPAVPRADGNRDRSLPTAAKRPGGVAGQAVEGVQGRSYAI